MSIIFFSGSRSITRLNADIRQRIINNVIKNQFDIVLGDANGADKAFQKLFAEQRYDKVQIFCSGTTFRNNLGNWQVNFVPSNQKGRDFYTEKDKKMAIIADYGFILWDGESIGSLNNISELLNHKNPSLIYHSPNKQFLDIKSFKDLKNIIDYQNKNLINDILKKGNLYLKQLVTPQFSLI